MKQYEVTVREVLATSVLISAESAEAAIEQVSEQYGSGKITLDYKNSCGDTIIEITEKIEMTVLIQACREFLQVAGFDYLTKMMNPTEDQKKNTELNGEALDLVMELEAVVKEVADRLKIETQTEKDVKQFILEKEYGMRRQLEGYEEIMVRYEDGLEDDEEEIAETLASIEAIEEQLELLAEMQQYVARKVKERK